MCNVWHKCTIYDIKLEVKFVVQTITDFNNIIGGEIYMESFTKYELINLIELLYVE